jgi:hypothetical protein
MATAGREGDTESVVASPAGRSRRPGEVPAVCSMDGKGRGIRELVIQSVR